MKSCFTSGVVSTGTALVILMYIYFRFCKYPGMRPPIFSRRKYWLCQIRAFGIKKANRGPQYETKEEEDDGFRPIGEWCTASNSNLMAFAPALNLVRRRL